MLWFILSTQAKYDAWEEDIAIVNIFFGKETVVGHFWLFSLKEEKNGLHNHIYFSTNISSSY